MKLGRVTITGADNSISPEALRSITLQYPFVEWGILVSHSSGGSGRFPSREWIKELTDIFEPKHLSLHVCGRWTRKLLTGLVEFPAEWINQFGRMQLNFHAENAKCIPDQLHSRLHEMGKVQFIFQIDGENGNEHLESLYAENGEKTVDAVPLFDISGGAGVLPKEWPKPQYWDTDQVHSYHGYAGGLGPDNLAEQIPLIAKAADDCRIWIDMETRVRSNNDALFDLDKVVRCLEISKPFIS